MPSGVYIRTKPVWNKGIKCPESSERMKGKNNPMFGKTGKKHHNYKNGKNKCENCETQLTNYKSKYCIKCAKLFFPIWNKGKHTGQIPPNRIGDGITPLNMKIRGSLEYINWRTQIFGRDNFTCQECGVRGSWLEAHHINEFNKIIKKNNINSFEEALLCEELWDLNNGITLCKECHKKTKRG